MRRKTGEAIASLSIVFPGNRSGRRGDPPFISVLGDLLDSLHSELGSPPLPSRLFIPAGKSPDSIDHINRMVLSSGNLKFFAALLRAVRDCQDITPASKMQARLRDFHMAHIARLATSTEEAVKKYLSLLEDGNRGDFCVLSRLVPDAAEFFSTGLSAQEMESEISRRLSDAPCEDGDFGSERAYRFSDGNFIPASMGPIRPAKQFFGYRETRELFKRHFQQFAAGNENIPLLISSLPGLGKTHFTISHALEVPEISIILCRPHDLEAPLEAIIGRLADLKSRKFVLFFDDLDTRKVDWYHFRTNVGGAFILPSNTCIVIASNFEFPANIISRGRGFTFPIFDELRCQEMIHDFLLFFGMRNPARELVSVIASDYVEEYGQHMFEELSPRTLVRYLERYNGNAEKRKKTLEMSRQKVIPVPDSSCFYDANQKVIERLSKSP